MKFQYFTYFLNPLSQQSLFPDTRDKNDILKQIVSKKMEFQNGQANLVYICHSQSNNFIHAKLGKKSSIKKTLPSENDFVEEIETNYPNCHLLFNFSSDPNTGQKIAFEYRAEIFKSPEAQLKALEKQINSELFSSGYAMSIHPIVDEKEFWTIVNSYQGKIEKLTFSYAVPNLFNLQNALSDDLKSSGEKYGITNTTIVLENKDGKLQVPSDDPFIAQSAEYTGKGGGEYKLKIKGLKSEISSGKNVKTKNFEELEFNTDNPESMETLINKIFTN